MDPHIHLRTLPLSLIGPVLAIAAVGKPTTMLTLIWCGAKDTISQNVPLRDGQQFVTA